MRITKISVIVSACLLFISTAYGQTVDTASRSKHSNMKQYSLLVSVPEDYSAEQVKAATPKWDQLVEKWKSTGVYVLSFAFPGNSYTITGPKMVTKSETVLSGHLKVVSNIVLRAETIEQALELAAECPVLRYGGKVEVREIPKPVTEIK